MLQAIWGVVHMFHPPRIVFRRNPKIHTKNLRRLSWWQADWNNTSPDRTSRLRASATGPRKVRGPHLSFTLLAYLTSFLWLRSCSTTADFLYHKVSISFCLTRNVVRKGLLSGGVYNCSTESITTVAATARPATIVPKTETTRSSIVLTFCLGMDRQTAGYTEQSHSCSDTQNHTMVLTPSHGLQPYL